MKMHTKHEVTKEILPRYLKASKDEKGKILDEFGAITGYHKKSAIRKLRELQMTPHSKEGIAGKHTRNRERKYDGYVEVVVEQLYEALGGIGSRRIYPLLETMIDKGIEFGHIKTDPITEMKVRVMSKSTLDRMITRVRERNAIKGISTTRPGTLLKSEIPLRVGVWEETDPGFSEIDLVAHCGDSGAGMFISTLNTTDIATAWFEAEAVMGKAQERVLDGMREIEARLPFTLAGIDSDNGSEFINRQLYGYCLKNKIIFTRSRPYKKNDNAHIEQKNYTTVRQVLGYQRFDTEEVLKLMKTLYRGPLRLYINFFQPSVKCVKKTRIGSRIKKIYDVAKTPYERVLAHPKISQKTKETLTRLFKSLDPFELRKEIDVLVREIQKRGRWHL
ncbi:MAG: transposase [bacterium]|nr:transposase [bacterium]